MMNDLISRQAAIAVADYSDYVGLSVDDVKKVTDEVVKGLRRLPSAYPADVVEVVRCKDCKWFNQIGCAICIVDDSDKPTENDFCSFGERRTE